MLNIKSFTFNPLMENTYVVSDETKACVIIDCGAYSVNEQDTLMNYITDEQLTPVRLLATHAHFDHNLGAGFISEAFGLQLELHERDSELYQQMEKQTTQLAGLDWGSRKKAPAKFFDETDIITFGNQSFEIIPTPGHTKGSVCFYSASQHILFSGDTLFKGTIGRTDLPCGSMFQMTNSLRRLCQLPDTTQIFPGHGPSTSMALELASNPFLDR